MRNTLLVAATAALLLLATTTASALPDPAVIGTPYDTQLGEVLDRTLPDLAEVNLPDLDRFADYAPPGLEECAGDVHINCVDCTRYDPRTGKCTKWRICNLWVDEVLEDFCITT